MTTHRQPTWVTHRQPTWVTKRPGESLVACQVILYKIFHISPFAFTIHAEGPPIKYKAKIKNTKILIFHRHKIVGKINESAKFISNGTERQHRTFQEWYTRLTNPMHPFTFKETAP